MSTKDKAPKKGAAPVDLEKQKKLLLKKCKNRAEVKAWIKHFINLDLPDTIVSRYATTTPLDIVYEMYRICVLNENPDQIQELLYTGSRGSGKTLGVAIAEFMIMLHDQRDIAHVGAIMSQAARAYEYIQSFCMSPKVKPIIDPPNTKDDKKILQKSTMSKSIFNVNDSVCTMEILPTTLKALNGVHCQLVSCDELDTLSGEGMRAIKEVSGMLDTKKGKKPLRVGISTRKTKYGLMNAMIENADKEGRHLRFWTALEFTERCPDERSGTVPTPLWLSQDTGESLIQEEYDVLSKNKQQGFVLESTGMFDKCKGCPAAAFCRGDAKKQTSKSNMLKTIGEHIQKIRSEGIDWAASQLYNLKPSTEGLVYPEFEERIHVKTWNEMWHKLTGKEFPGECTHDMFVKKVHELKLPVYAGLDWGFTNPNTVVYFAADSRDNIYVLKTDAMTHVSQPTWIHHCKTKYHSLYRCQLYFPDTADQGSIQEMQKVGLPVSNSPKGEINAGIQVIKKFLRVPGTSDTRLFIAKETNLFLINEFSLYHFKANAAGEITDTPEGENDHALDALRYAMTQLYGKGNIVLGGGLSFDTAFNLTDNNGNFSRTPTAAEFASTMGIKLNENDQDVSKLGKIGTKSDLDDSDDGEGNGDSGGSFLWSF